MRISGLASGMDIDSMVKELMTAQRVPLDNLTQKKTQLEWKKEEYTTIYEAVRDFRNTVFNYQLDNTLSPRNVVSSDEATVAATASGDAADVSHTLVVSALAKGAANVSQSDIAEYKSTIGEQFGISGTVTIAINGQTVSVDSSQSMYDFTEAINKSGAGVKASYDATVNRFFLYSATTGSEAKIDFTGTGAGGQAFLKNQLNLAQDSETGELALLAQGQDAAFNLDGIDLIQASNNFSIAGVNYQLKAEGTVTVAISSDIDKAVENVQALVDSYNKVLEQINTKLNEKRDRDYMPLTDEQKNDMEDSDIETWQKKARTGLLQRDPILQNLVSNMRNSMASIVGGVTGDYRSASSIGITTGDYSEGGKLYLNETKLRTALQEDPEILNKLFATEGDSEADSGIAQRLYDDLANAMTKLNNEAGVLTLSADTDSVIAKQLSDYNDRIDTLTDRLADMEERYYNQFDAMEAAINQLNQQATWLAQQFGTSQSE